MKGTGTTSLHVYFLIQQGEWERCSNTRAGAEYVKRPVFVSFCTVARAQYYSFFGRGFRDEVCNIFTYGCLLGSLARWSFHMLSQKLVYVVLLMLHLFVSKVPTFGSGFLGNSSFLL